jgi:AraC family transcriptional regulator, transcriptional activator FtrA
MAQGSSQLHRVAVLVADNSNPFEVACAVEVFGGGTAPDAPALYDVQLCSPGRRARMRDDVFTMLTTGALAALDDADTVVVPNRPDVSAPNRPVVLAAIRKASARGARLVGLCTGAFTLAEAGVLDGRRATVHWLLADEFRDRHPQVQLTPDVLYVDDGDILTSAGSAAALDLALHIVRLDHGAEVANTVSRRLVFSAHRDGGQRQFVQHAVPTRPDTSLGPVLEWARDRLDQPLTVALLADRAGMSVATLHRRFQTQLGTTPWAWLTAERTALACRLIETESLTLEGVARRSGLGTTANLRTLIKRSTGLSPSAYAARFSLAHLDRSEF